MKGGRRSEVGLGAEVGLEGRRKAVAWCVRIEERFKRLEMEVYRDQSQLV